MVKEFAEYFSLTIWDWFTAIVAVISLIVAVFAFVIAIKTYRVSKKTLASQQQTEKNTTPVRYVRYQSLWHLIHHTLILLLQKRHQVCRYHDCLLVFCKILVIHQIAPQDSGRMNAAELVKRSMGLAAR